MKNEGAIETSLNIKKYFHKKSTSNYNGKSIYNKIPSNKKINISNNKPQDSLSKIKIKIKNIQKSIPKLNNENIGNNKIKRIKCIDKINYIESLNKVNNNSKTIQHVEHTDTEYDNSLKKYPTSTIVSKNHIIISKKNKNSTLIRTKIQRNSEMLNLNRSKNDFSTNFLFKNNQSNQSNSKDPINKSTKKSKNLFISYLVKKVGNKSNNSENKIYNSNHNILTLNRNTLNRDISKRICKNNTSSQLRCTNKIPYNNNSSMIQSASSQISHNENNVHNLYFNENSKATTINIIKKFIKIYTSGNSCKNNLLINNNFFFPSQKNFGTLNHNKSNNYIKHSNIIDTIDNSNINNKKIGKNYLKKKIKVIKNNNFDKEKLKKFKTEKELELIEVDKNMYQLIQKKKKRIYLDSKDLSQKKILSFDLNKNENLKKIYKKLEKSEDLEKNIEIPRNLISPIKEKDKKDTNTHLCLTIETKKKKNLINKKSKEKVNGSKNKKATNTNINVRKRGKKNLSIQIETKYIYQKNNIFQNDKYRKFLIEKNNAISENNASDIYNHTNTYNTIQTKPVNPFDTSNNNYIRNNYSDSKYNNNYKNVTNYIKTMNKSKVSTIDFDNFNKNSKNKNKEKVLKKKNNNSNIKIKNICQINKRKNSNDNKVKFLRKKYKKKKKIDINDEIDDKEMTYINDSFIEEDLDEEYLVRDTTQSTNNMTKINTKMKSHFMNVLKHRNNLKLKSFPKVSMPLLSLFKEKNIINEILLYCDYDTLNKLCLINKEHYKYLKPIVYEKIKLKIIEINKSSNNLNNIIKKSILIYTPLSKLSKVMLQKNYFDLLYEVNEKYEVDIKKDLLRTLPDDISFKYGKENYNKLYHILSAYSNYNKNIGYAQGLNFLAAICLCIFKDEIDSFIFLDGLIQKFKFENLFGIKNDELNVKLKEIEYCVDKWCPEIKKYLQTRLLNYDFFTCKWMITLFSNSMNIKYLFQLWDYMIIFGWKFFKFFVIAVIKFNEIKILNCSLEKITKTMNEILKTREFEDNFINIINITFQYINKDNEII